MNDFTEIAAHEIVYMHTLRTSDGALLRRLLWQENGQTHRASFDAPHAAQMGLDILEGSILCVPWAMAYSVVEIALFETMTL